ncbi:DUF4397 domain-containing protein [Halobaculum rubrum]|uniref:DUF4397 domain-containing protein n=1 Tax=Halobaculum rubrum TaxID=2872158 RepID=UPI001CEC55D1|nr:DUF4397 domain-containing protein [Halobaculum rubrum]
MTRRTLSRRQLTAALGAAVGVGLAGCGGATNNSTNATDEPVGTVEAVTDEGTPGETEAETEGMTGTPEPPETTDEPAAAVADGMAVTRIAHLAPDAPNVDVSVGGTEILTDVTFGTVSDYYVLEPSTYAVTVTAAGEDEAVFEEEIQFDNGAVTVGAFGEVSGQNREFSVTSLEDRVEPPADDTAAVRVVHASPDAPPVTVGVADGDTLFEGVAFGEASDYAEVPAGSYSLEIAAAEEAEAGTETGTEAGTENGTATGTENGTATGTAASTGTGSTATVTPGDSGPVATVDVSLAGGTVSSAFATGYLTPDGEAADIPFELLLTVDAGAAATGTGTPDEAENGTESGTDTGTGTEGSA